MITISSETIDKHWASLEAGEIASITFSQWDDGDAYVDISVAPLFAKDVPGAIVIGDSEVEEVIVVVRLLRNSGTNDQELYDAPNGERYQVVGEVSGAKSSEVKIEGIAAALDSRRASILETDALSQKSVCVVGLGTGGVSIAVELAKAGVGSYFLVDSDRLTIGNVSRHHAGLSFVGRMKVNAVRDLILDKNPRANVRRFPFKADEAHRSEVLEAINESDIVICATDSRPSKLFVNALCVEAEKAVLFGGAFRRAYGGQVLRVRPRDSACYHCFVLAVPEKESDREIASSEDADAIAYSDQPVPVEPGLSIDVAPISTMMAKLALQELIRREPSGLHVLDKDLDANWYLWINRPEPDTEYASLPPLSECSDEMTVLRWYGIYLERESGCPTCGDFGQSLREKYDLTDDASDAPQIRPFPPESVS